MTETTRDKLILHAALLFQERGFHGVGVSDILAASGVPKGSLYHHFKDGKSDLALAAADWTSAKIIGIFEDAFGDAPDFDSGLTTLCHKLAKLFDTLPVWRACPIAANLFDGPNNEVFREKSGRIFQDWTDVLAAHAARLGIPNDQTKARARLAFIAIQGAWTLAYAQGTSDVLRDLPKMLYLAPANAHSS